MSLIDKRQIILKSGIGVVIRTVESKDSAGIIDVMKSVMKEKIFYVTRE